MAEDRKTAVNEDLIPIAFRLNQELELVRSRLDFAKASELEQAKRDIIGGVNLESAIEALENLADELYERLLQTRADIIKLKRAARIPCRFGRIRSS